MILNIGPDVMTHDLRSEFSDNFDGLKIEFFMHHHDHQQGSPKKDMVTQDLSLSKLNPEISSGNIEILPTMSVNAVEDRFESYGLHIQIFRQMNISWIETTATDSYTLEEQIALSRESRGLNS